MQQKIKSRSLIGFLLALLLSACIAPTGRPLAAPTTTVGAATNALPVATDEAADCSQPTGETTLLRHAVQGYCLLYPAGYEAVELPVGYNMAIGAPTTTQGHRERLFITVEDAAGRTAEEAAQQVVTDYSLPGLALEVSSDLQIDGEPAFVVDHVPGQDFTRRVLFAHEGLLYSLMFTPSDPGQPEAFAEMEALYTVVIDSFGFLPVARYAGAPGLLWQGQVEGEQGKQCQQLHLFRNSDALIGGCDEAGTGVVLGSKQAREWAEIMSIFAPFAFESSSDQVTFYGNGQTGSVAWQHAITAWAHTTYQELASGRASAAGNTVLSWWLGEVPEHPGYCDHLVVLAYGYANIRVDPCAGGGEPIALAESWLQTNELEPFDGWLQQRAPLYQGDNYFSGLGTTEMSEVSQLADWAKQVYRRIEQATPSYLAAAAADAVGPTGRIVFGSRRSGDMDIYSMAPDGSDPLRLSTGDTFDSFPAPSPDGSRIAFVAEIMDSQRTPVERDIFVVNVDGSGSTNLTNYPGFDMEPVWSPDSQQLAFTSTRDGDGTTRSIYTMAADGSDLQLLVANAEQPAWSPAGDAIAFVQAGQIFLIALADGQITQLTDAVSPSAQATPNSGPVWSPDGKAIAFVSNRDGNTEIYRMNADGSEQTNLTNQPGYEATPVWSPDGAWIAFTSDGSAEPGIYVMQADGGAALKVTDAAIGEFLPTWSPDSNWLAFVSDPAAQIIIRANVQEMTRVGRVTPEALSPGGDTFPVWMP